METQQPLIVDLAVKAITATRPQIPTIIERSLPSQPRGLAAAFTGMENSDALCFCWDKDLNLILVSRMARQLESKGPQVRKAAAR